jgi:topoisomerase IA-like protein
VIANLGEKDGFAVRIKDGPFCVYISWEKVNAKLPVDYADSPKTTPLKEAWFLIREKGGNIKAAKAGEIELPTAPKWPKSAYLNFCAEK